MPWAGPGYRSDLADECGRGQNSLRRRLEALGWSRLALPSPDDQSGTIAHQRAVVEIQGWSTLRVGHQSGLRCTPHPAAGKTPTALQASRHGYGPHVGWTTPCLVLRPQFQPSPCSRALLFQPWPPGSTRLSSRALRAAREMPDRATSAVPSFMPPMPNTSVTETMIRLRGCDRSTWLRIRVFRPTTAMEPNSRQRMPPITGAGMLCSAAPNLPTKAMRMAKQAAQVMIFGL